MSIGTFATRDLHVGASDRQCVRHVLKKLTPEAKAREHRGDRHALLRASLQAHHEHQGLVRDFRL